MYLQICTVCILKQSRTYIHCINSCSLEKLANCFYVATTTDLSQLMVRLATYFEIVLSLIYFRQSAGSGSGQCCLVAKRLLVATMINLIIVFALSCHDMMHIIMHTKTSSLSTILNGNICTNENMQNRCSTY